MIDCSVLFVDDDELIRRVMERGLSKHIKRVTCSDNPADALRAIDETSFDIVVTALRTNDPVSDADMSGIKLIQSIKEHHPNTEIVVQTGFGSLESAERATRAGAYDYIEKPYKVERLVMVIERALQHRKLRNEVMLLKQQVAFDYSYDGLIGDSVTTLRFKEAIARAAEKDTFVLISGEKGTGKSTAAKIIHHHSLRRKRPVITIACGETPQRLIDSELFGPGSSHQITSSPFSGGALANVTGGTLILKDIEKLPKDTQRKLASVLQACLQMDSNPTSEGHNDVRIIATACADLPESAIAGAFSTELLSLLEVTSIEAPALRDRTDDILPLARRFMKDAINSAMDGSETTERYLSGAALEKLMNYSWPENVSELRSVLRRADALARTAEITADDIFFVSKDQPTEALVRTPALNSGGSLEMTYRARILRSLEDNNWNYSQTAAELGIGRTTLWRKVKKYNLSKGLVGE